MIRTQHQDTVFEIILDRPEKRNAINWSMMQALEQAIIAAEQTAGVRAVIVRAQGDAFSAGIDLLGFPQLVEAFGENWQENLFPVTQAMQAVFNRFERSSLPVIALLHGYCLGIGMELALACDFRIVAEGTRMALPESRLGLIPDVGGTTRLTRLVGPGRAKDLIMTGRDILPDEAERWGLVNRVLAADELRDTGQSLAEQLVLAAPLAVSYAKRVIDGFADIDRGLALEAWAQSVLIRSEDFANGANAMLTRQTVEWKGR